MPAHKHFTKHQIISHNGTVRMSSHTDSTAFVCVALENLSRKAPYCVQAGKNLCAAPLTGAVVQCLEVRQLAYQSLKAS